MDMSTGTTTAAPDVIQGLKEPTSEATVANSGQIPSQSLSVAVMQQAVALQQFQFQQALMMQQILAQQQAASRAVNVKTASELALARAAEISKLLKGESASDEKGNVDEASLQRAKSPCRSRHSPSPSQSSGSKSRSPIRYRRDRSRSPIRYRHNRYSPREYRSRGSRGYRGYYRGGREDYSRSSYRRDWDHARDRDYCYRIRRSRSTSRSRLRKRSPTRSRSPRRHWGRSASPKRDERLSERSSRRQRYRVSKSPPSSSRSPSASSDHGNERKSRALRHNKRDTCFRRSPSWGSMSPIGKNDNASIDDAGSSEKHIASDVKPLSEVASLISGDNQREKRGVPEQDMESREVSSSPARSLSVSVDRSSSEASKDSKLQGWKGRNVEKESTLLLGTEQDLKEVGKEIDDGELLLRHAGQIKNDHGFKFSHRDEGNIEDEEEIDDWRNDIKAQAMERLKRRDIKEIERRAKREEDKKSTSWTSVNPECSYYNVKAPCEVKSEHRDSTMDIQTNLNEETGVHRGKTLSDEQDGFQSLSLKDRVERNQRERIDSEDEEQSSMSKDGDGNVKDGKTERSDRQWTSDMLYGEENANGKDSCAIEAVDSGNEVVIFEGPLPASEIYGWPEQGTCGNADNRDVVGISENDSKREDEHEQANDVGASVMLPEDLEGAEIAQCLGIGMNDEMFDNARDGHKSKHRSRSKEKKGKHEDHGGDIRRKDRHKKHQRRHKQEEEEDDVTDGKESGRHKEKRRHKRSHRRHDDGRREKKKRKHKHRGRSVTSSSEKSVFSDVGKKEKDSCIVRKKSSQHKRKREPSPTRETSLSN